MTQLKNLKEKQEEELAQLLEYSELDLKYYGEKLVYLYGKDKHSTLYSEVLNSVTDLGYRLNYVSTDNEGKLKVCLYQPK